MEYRTLGRTGLKVSELCLGAMTFGREASEEESGKMLDRFVAAGGNFIDTADVYTLGKSEEILGRWIKGRDREDLVVATKLRWGTDDPDARRPNRFGLGRKHMIAEVEASLRRLQTDYIDLYQVHMFDRATPVEETLATMEDLVRAGKIRYAGASNHAGWQLQKAVDLAREKGWRGYVSLQPLYNLLDRELEWDLVPVCLNEGLGIMPWSPLRGGWLSGKYHRGLNAAPSGTRVEIADAKGWSESWARYNTDHTWAVLDAVAGTARARGKTPAQVALNWLLRRPGVTSPIVGARNLAQLDDNLGASGWALTAEEMNRLNEVSAKPLPYPHDALLRS